MSRKIKTHVAKGSSKLFSKTLKAKARSALDFHAGRLGKKSKALYNNGFLGMEPDRVYWDPRGFMVQGGMNACKSIRDALMPAFEKWDQAVDEGATMDQAIAIYRAESASALRRKTLATSSWNIPIFAVQGVPVVKPGMLPLSTLVVRVGVDRDQIQTTPLTTVGAAANITESTTEYTFTDDTYYDGDVTDYTFDVKGYGRGNVVSELMSLVNNAYASTRQVTADAQLSSIRRKEERQIFQGTNLDASSFSGLYDFAESTGGGYSEDMSSTALTNPDDIRAMIDVLTIDNGAMSDDLIGATDRSNMTHLKNDLQDFVRTGSPLKNYELLDVNNGIDIKLKAVMIDGVPIFGSYGAPTTTNLKEVIMTDMSYNFMAMVQDATLKPLAFIGPTDRMATDAYGCLVSRGHARTGKIYGIE